MSSSHSEKLIYLKGLTKVTDSLQDFCQKFSEAVQNMTKEEETTTKKTSQKRKIVRDPELPKRPLGSYFHFCNEQRKLNEKETTLDVSALAKIHSERWRNLSEKEKQPYINMGGKDWKTYREAMAEYKVTHPDAKKQKTTETKPKGEALSKNKPKEVVQAPGQENSDNSSSGEEEETAIKKPEDSSEEEEDENSEEEKSAFKKSDGSDDNDNSNEEDSSEEEKSQSDSSDDSDSEGNDSSSDEE
ncbi:unnamed protein product [Rhizopus stolonifer]